MKKTTSQLTVLELSPYIGLPIVYGLVVVYFIIQSFHTTTLTCQRETSTTANCHLINSNLIGHQPSTISLNTLPDAEAYVKITYGSKSATHTIVIPTQTGNLEITRSGFSGKKEYIVQQINSFIRNKSEKFLEVKDESDREYFWLALPCLGFGFISLLIWGVNQIEILTCSVDYTLSRISLRQINFMSLSNGIIDWSIQEIDSVAIESTSYSIWRSIFNIKYRSRTYTKYYIVLVLKSGERIRLSFLETVFLKNKQTLVEYVSTLCLPIAKYQRPR